MGNFVMQIRLYNIDLEMGMGEKNSKRNEWLLGGYVAHWYTIFLLSVDKKMLGSL